MNDMEHDRLQASLQILSLPQLKARCENLQIFCNSPGTSLEKKIL